MYGVLENKIMEEKHRRFLESIQNSIRDTVPKEKIGVAFSGGVDSTLLAKICHDMRYDVVLLTIGFPNSHDVLFAKEINEQLGYSHKILEIDSDSFSKISTKIKERIQTENLSWNENGIAFYYVSKLAHSLGIKTVVTANGIDELFCGYNAYREAIEKGNHYVLKLMASKLENEKKMMRAVNAVTSEFDVKLIQPFLSEDFVSYANTIPITEKIKDKDDLYRKHIIRSLAKEIGVPTISSEKRKKALQYGSNIHKALIKSR